MSIGRIEQESGENLIGDDLLILLRHYAEGERQEIGSQGIIGIIDAVGIEHVLWGAVRSIESDSRSAGLHHEEMIVYRFAQFASHAII